MQRERVLRCKRARQHSSLTVPLAGLVHRRNSRAMPMGTSVSYFGTGTFFQLGQRSPPIVRRRQLLDDLAIS
jgi:hypothetical protein